MFAFESTVHSCNVLQRLDDLRRRDLLCDVTVVVEGQNFRAHRSILASCSEFFTHRTQQEEVIMLPQEVTVAGFEPLLKFAYTSKLLFNKENILDIKNSALFLGFHDVEEACFDFLRPKFTIASTGLCPSLKKSCCKKKYKRQLSQEDSTVNPQVNHEANPDSVLLEGKAVKPVADSPSQQEVASPCSQSNEKESPKNVGSFSPATVGVDAMQIPNKFQRKESLNLREDCEVSGRCLFNVTARGEVLAQQQWRSELHEWKIEDCKGMVNEDERESDDSIDSVKVAPCSFSQISNANDGRSVQGERSRLIMHHDLAGSKGQDRFVVETPKDKTPELLAAQQDEALHDDNPGLKRKTCCRELCGKDGSERDNMEREVAEHLATRLGSDLLDADRCGSLLVRHTSAESPQVNIGPSCPFLLQDRRSCCWKGTTMSEGEGASQSGVSSFTSGDDGDSEMEGESEAYTRERARQMQLPFAIDWIVGLSRNEFQQLLKQQLLTLEQQDFVHDMRRRSKNRQAAQRCRKRKLDCIYNLQCEINKLRSEREKLIVEKNQLSQLKVKTCRGVSVLCEQICEEAALKPEQLQVLAKYSSSDCPLFPHVDFLLSQSGASLHTSLSGCQDGIPSEITSQDAQNSAQTPHL